MSAGHLIVAYHGCDIVTRDALVRGQLRALKQSQNKYDWLGPGVYFFENDPERALRFADASQRHPERLYTKQPIVTPAVVGAVLRVQHWLDMTTQAGIVEFANAYEALSQVDHALPTNHQSHPDDRDFILRQLDNAVFSYLHEVRHERGMTEYQVVRGAFGQGDEVSPHSGFRLDSHIQLAVRDQACVVGWFLPSDATLLPPEELAARQIELEAAKASQRKPRHRAGRTI